MVKTMGLSLVGLAGESIVHVGAPETYSTLAVLETVLPLPAASRAASAFT